MADVEKYLYLVMPNAKQTIPGTHPELAKEYKFPFSHFFTGFIISCVGMICLNYILPDDLDACLIPEILVVGTLVWLAIRSHKSGERGYKSSYISIVVIYMLCFCLLYILLSLIGGC